MRRTMVVLFTILLAVISLASPLVSSAASQCFTVPGISNCIEGRFSDYWQQNGGLPVFGYPITASANEPNRDTGKSYQTQWFERNRYELHTENAAPYDVLLGRLGAEALTKAGRDWQTFPKAQPNATHYFGQTGHAIAHGPFWQYWSTHGLLDPKLDAFARSLALFGLPLSEPTIETNSSGDRVLTQWFERARFEDHGATGVLLGLLGNEVRGDAPPAPQPNPRPAADVKVVSSTTYVSQSIKSRYIVGEVRNDTGSNAKYVEIVASLYDASNKLVGTDNTFAQLDILKPGQKSPFRVIVSDPPAIYDHYTLTVQWRTTDEKPLEGLTVLSSGDRPTSYDANTRYIFGEVRNDSGGPVKYFEIIITMYRENGDVVSTGYTFTKIDQLAPGQTSPFETTVEVNGATNYQIVVQARRP
jgi:hypothetical protein